MRTVEARADRTGHDGDPGVGVGRASRPDAVAQAMGAAKVDSLQITGGGFMYTLGQAYQPGKAWPKLNLSRFTRSDDYAGAAHAFDYYVSRASLRAAARFRPRAKSGAPAA